jgi:chaperonin cofactor prefoldin
VPDLNVPNFDVNKAAAEINDAVRDAAYVAVGLGVLGFQKAQVQRVELTKQLEAQLSQLSTLPSQVEAQLAQLGAIPSTLQAQLEAYLEMARSQAETARSQLAEQLSELGKAIDEALSPLRQQFEEQIDRLEEALPATARNVVQSVRTAASTQEQALRSAVGLA